MTNYEWVKENRKEVIRKSLYAYLHLHGDRAVNSIIDGDDVIKEAICGRCSVDRNNNDILLFEIPHNYNSDYLVTRSSIMLWLDKERELPLLYPIGTIVTDPDGELWFYNGINPYSMTHCYVNSADRIGKYADTRRTIPSGAEYNNEEAKLYFKSLKLTEVKVVDGYINGKGEE